MEETKNEPQAGEPAAKSTETTETTEAKTPGAAPTLEERIVEALRTVYDPEIPVNIYDLGLIYDLQIGDDANVNVKMTLTAPGCPVAGEMPGWVETTVRGVADVTDCDVELVWEPQWNPDMMSEEARLTLNI